MTQVRSDAILERMMALHPKVMDLVLDRVWRLLGALGNPQNDLPPVVHIAGTNGKGSTQAMIRAGLEADGHRVHAYTSPHLARFHERIRLAGTLITEDKLTSLLDECYTANDGAPITYFEITTVAAILAFARTPADYTLLEVGLGGRLDATNVVEAPALSVITPVSIDHQQFLGDTLAQIAGEKAGIIKRRIPCVVARQEDDALDVIEAQARRLGAPLSVHGQDWHVASEHGRLVYHDDRGLLDLPMPSLLGQHQVQNAGTAIAALRRLGASDTACEAAVVDPVWPARMQRLRKGPLVDLAKPIELWLDGGHNRAAGEALAETLASLAPRPTHLICGMLNTKDVAGYLRPLSKVAASLVAVSIPGETNTMDAAQTCEIAKSVGMPATSAPSVTHAVSKIAEETASGRILICGSLYLAGQILRDHG